MRGDNDLISIGPAPNIAAKLSDLRDAYSLHITDEVYAPMSNEVAFMQKEISLFYGQKQMQQVPIWSPLAYLAVGNKYFRPLGSNAWWEPS